MSLAQGDYLMQSQLIEAGQRLNLRTGEKSGIVLAQMEAIVPAGYWICKDEASGQRRVIAATALSPLEAPPLTIEPNQPPAFAASTALAPLAAPPLKADLSQPPAFVASTILAPLASPAITAELSQPAAFVASTPVSTSGGPPDGRVAA
jgi:hypothetical protein